jgi:hypothetical protein
MLVQYNTAGDLVTENTPYPLNFLVIGLQKKMQKFAFSTKSSRFKFSKQNYN